MLPDWEIAVDTGGTFTDCLAVSPDGSQLRAKVLSSGCLRARVVAHPARSVVILNTSWDTTPGLFVGFTAVLGRETFTVTAWEPGERRLIFNREVPSGIHATEIEIRSGEDAPVLAIRLLTETPMGAAFPTIKLRLATTRATNALLERKTSPCTLYISKGLGDLLEIGDQRRPDLFALRHRKAASLYDQVEEVDEGFQPKSVPTTAAIALRGSYRNPADEKQLAARLRELGCAHVSVSGELAPMIRLLPRAQTAVVNACLAPTMENFIRAVREPLMDAEILLMTSSGGLEEAENYHPKDSLLSGPAGGVAGAAAFARAAGFDRIISFDMGGTSTDVARYDGDYIYQFEHRVGAATLLSPSLKIETVAAGGGSICELTPQGLTVGPASASADPGPACYGRGGPLTLTDVNFLLGRLDESNVGIPLDREASARRLSELMQSMKDSALPVPDEKTLLHGLLDIAVERMASAIRRISLREGFDPSEYTLVAFGGAGPQHACAVAENLGIDTILVPSDAGLLSAVGLRHARMERLAECQVLAPLDEFDTETLNSLQHQALSQVPGGKIVRQIAEVRLSGQDSALPVDFHDPHDIAGAFHECFEKLFAYPPPADRHLELVSLRVLAAREASLPNAETFRSSNKSGPILLRDPFSTIYVSSGWSVSESPAGSRILKRKSPGKRHSQTDPLIEMELYRSRISAIVEDMGAQLQRTAISTNVKERADFSCAILDSSGQLVMNAPHIPVHLGALGLCVREIARQFDVAQGDMIITNHPAFGGSHLPDVTLVSAAFDADGKRIAYVANRAHHAEIGGIAPGSMPTEARTLEEEGVVITPQWLYRAGTPCFDDIEDLLQASRRISDNMADLRAQAASNIRAVRDLQKLSPERVRECMENILSRSQRAFEVRIESVLNCHAIESLDDGSEIHARITKASGRLRIDFEGTTPRVHPGNLNATPAIVRSAVLYVLRLLIDEDVPLNEGLLRNVDIVLPDCFLAPDFDKDDPSRCPPVVGGNVETSQRIVDTLIKAFDIQACSQGTMNNFLFGSPAFGYYETIAGGAGAGRGYDGASALHTHMTNTAITDIEVLESRYPVKVREFSIRRGSGGNGRWRGGDGLVREIEFLAPLTVSLLTQHRKTAPYGIDGGTPGTCGRQILTRKDGATHRLDSIASFEALPGDVLRIESPGGGGCGSTSS